MPTNEGGVREIGQNATVNFPDVQSTKFIEDLQILGALYKDLTRRLTTLLIDHFLFQPLSLGLKHPERTSRGRNISVLGHFHMNVASHISSNTYL